MKEYSKGIYVKFKPEEVEILHDRMKEAGVQNMSAYISEYSGLGVRAVRWLGNRLAFI